MKRPRDGEGSISAYQRRRRRVVWGLVIFSLVAGVCTLVGTLINGAVGATAFLVAVAVWAAWFYRTWRCPACGRSLILADGEDGLSRCPSCDARLED